MADLMTEVARFRAWDDSIPIPIASRYGEWECDYEEWPLLYEAVLTFVAVRPFESWAESELRAILYAIARDNEMQHLAREIRKRHPEILPHLARAALQMGERDDRWQLAVELGHLGKEAEPLLLELARDEHEYVRRLALKALLDIGSSAVEQLSLDAWNRPDEHQEWARMMALFCLQKLGSYHLEPLLAEAELDSRMYLREYSARIRRGESLD
jgi:hypothetical protein